MTEEFKPINGAARGFLRRVYRQTRIAAVTDDELRYASSCVAAGYLQRDGGHAFIMTPVGHDYLARLARCE